MNPETATAWWTYDDIAATKGSLGQSFVGETFTGEALSDCVVTEDQIKFDSPEWWGAGLVVFRKTPSGMYAASAPGSSYEAFRTETQDADWLTGTFRDSWGRGVMIIAFPKESGLSGT